MTTGPTRQPEDGWPSWSTSSWTTRPKTVEAGSLTTARPILFTYCNAHASQCLLSNRSADHNESDIRPELLSITYSLDNVQRHNRHVKIMGKQACQGPHTEHEGGQDWKGNNLGSKKLGLNLKLWREKGDEQEKKKKQKKKPTPSLTPGPARYTIHSLSVLPKTHRSPDSNNRETVDTIRREEALLLTLDPLTKTSEQCKRWPGLVMYVHTEQLPNYYLGSMAIPGYWWCI